MGSQQLVSQHADAPCFADVAALAYRSRTALVRSSRDIDPSHVIFALANTLERYRSATIFVKADMPRPKDKRLAEMNTALRAMADPIRLRILALLGSGEVCVCHIHEALNIPQPTASRHLAYLRRAGLVETRRDGPWMHYSAAKMSDHSLRTIVEAVTQCVGQIDAVARDRKRLQTATGCCDVELHVQQRIGEPAIHS